MSALLQLNTTWLRRRVAERGLRQWWLAVQLGVDRRTVLGRPVAEQLIRAAAVADLPVEVLRRLYHQLCVACWRQSKLVEAAAHNATALELAERCGDQALHAEALGSRANLQFWRGELDAAWATWHEALALAPWLGPRQRGALHNNLGASLAEAGRAEDGRPHLLQALACFELEGTPMNHSITHGLLALLAWRERDAAAMARHNAQARLHAQRGDYRRGLVLADLVDGVAAAWAGDAPRALALVAQALAAYAAQGISESLNQRLAADVWLALGDLAAAHQAADEALRLCAGFPAERQAAEALSRRVTGAAAGGPLPSHPLPT